MNIQPVTARALRRVLSNALLAVSSAGFAAAAHADTRSALFGVSATVVHACNVSGVAMVAGSFKELSGRDVDAVRMPTATCTAGSGFTIGMRVPRGAAATGAASGTASGMPQAIPVYGSITAGQASAALGVHNDTIVATIDF